MTWKDELKKKDDLNIEDSKAHMIDQILDRMEDIENDLDESVTKKSMVALLEALSAIELVKEEKSKAKKTGNYEFNPSSYLDSKTRGGDFDGQGV